MKLKVVEQISFIKIKIEKQQKKIRNKKSK